MLWVIICAVISVESFQLLDFFDCGKSAADAVVMQCQQLVRLDIEFINRKRNLRADDDSLALTFHFFDSLQLLVVELRTLLHDIPQFRIFFVH